MPDMCYDDAIAENRTSHTALRANAHGVPASALSHRESITALSHRKDANSPPGSVPLLLHNMHLASTTARLPKA
jgi:hypothetical protein